MEYAHLFLQKILAEAFLPLHIWMRNTPESQGQDFFCIKKTKNKKQIISLCLPGETAAICIHYLAYRAESGNNAASILEIKPTAHEAWTF